MLPKRLNAAGWFKMQTTQTENPAESNPVGDRICAEAASQATVYFDGACPLCTAEIKHYASRLGAERLSFVDVSSQSADLGPDLTPDAAASRFHLRHPDGQLISGARAFVAIWETLPSWAWAARLARIPGAMIVLEGAYRLFLPIRPALSWIASRFGAKAANPTNRKGNRL